MPKIRSVRPVLRTIPSRAALTVRAVFAPARLQLAGKAALAAGIAWTLAPLMPGPAAEVPYYAPFGALITMYPTVAGSLRQGLQSLAGLACGVGLAFALAAFGRPTPWLVGSVIGLGILLSGVPRVGGGKDWIPTAALFVLVVGGADPGSFSFGYLLQTAVGVAVGLAVNLLLLPPLRFSAAAASLERGRQELAGQLADMGAAMAERWPPDHEDWSRRQDRLADAARDVRTAVGEADSSRRGNPRQWRHHRDLNADYAHVRQLERVTFHVQDITEVLADAIYQQSRQNPVPAELCGPLGQALTETGALLQCWNDGDARAQLRAAAAAVEHVSAYYHRLGSPEKPVSATASMTLSLDRIVRIVRVSLPEPA